MKKLNFVVLAAVLAVLCLVTLSTPKKVSAAACSNVSTFGSVSLSIPELTGIYDRLVWIRMQGTPDGGKVLVEINDTECLEINGDMDQAGTWKWYTFRPNEINTTVNFPSANGNKIKIIGVEDGTKVDKAIITDKNCVPQDYGNSCQAVVFFEDGPDKQVTALTPPSKGPVSGRVLLSQTPTINESNIDKVQYVVDNKVILTTNKPDLFDTRLLENGSHTVYITTTLKDGSIVREMVDLEIKNPENALSPIIRWLLLNKQGVKIFLISLISFVLIISIIKLYFNFRRKKRERIFHGI